MGWNSNYRDQNVILTKYKISKDGMKIEIKLYKVKLQL